MYSKTRWCSLWNTTDSLLRARPIFEWIKCEHPNILTNKNVSKYIEDKELFRTCKIISEIFKPIKTAINIVESKTATMADCYIEYIKLAIAINWIPQENVLKNNAVSIFNRRYKEFDHDVYLLGYFLHPGCRGLGLKKGTFRRICKIASEYWKALNNDEDSCSDLLDDLRKYKRNQDPFDMEYKKESETSLNWWLTFEDEDKESPLIKLAIKLFSIMPSQAGCERNFSMLRWFYGNNRHNLDVHHVESMAKIQSYYLTNIKKELIYYEQDLTQQELRDSVNGAIIYDIDELLFYSN